MKLISLIFYCLLILTIIIIGSEEIHIKEYSETFPVTINISDMRMLNVHMSDEDKILNFGTAFPGIKVQKTITLERGEDPPAIVNIDIDGEIKNWTTLDRNNFILGEPTDINITMTIPNNTENHNYGGNLTINYVSTLITVMKYYSNEVTVIN